MPYIRTTKNAQELSEARSRAAKMRKTKAGGRPPRIDKDGKPVKRASKTIGVRTEAFETFQTLARVAKKTMADFMDTLAAKMRAKNPEHFK